MYFLTSQVTVLLSKQIFKSFSKPPLGTYQNPNLAHFSAPLSIIERNTKQMLTLKEIKKIYIYIYIKQKNLAQPSFRISKKIRWKHKLFYVLIKK